MGENGLWLIGLGPGDLEQMTVAALDAARSADHRFLEGYTALSVSYTHLTLPTILLV